MNVYITYAHYNYRVNISKKVYICSLCNAFKKVYMCSVHSFFFIVNNQAI